MQQVVGVLMPLPKPTFGAQLVGGWWSRDGACEVVVVVQHDGQILPCRPRRQSPYQLVARHIQDTQLGYISHGWEAALQLVLGLHYIHGSSESLSSALLRLLSSLWDQTRPGSEDRMEPGGGSLQEVHCRVSDHQLLKYVETLPIRQLLSYHVRVS